jgi:hypothetical protein
MSSFKKKGWIAYGHNHLLVNVEALRNFVCSRRAVLDGD